MTADQDGSSTADAIADQAFCSGAAKVMINGERLTVKKVCIIIPRWRHPPF